MENENVEKGIFTRLQDETIYVCGNCVRRVESCDDCRESVDERDGVYCYGAGSHHRCRKCRDEAEGRESEGGVE